jgi:hypothetical protein
VCSMSISYRLALASTTPERQFCCRTTHVDANHEPSSARHTARASHPG